MAEQDKTSMLETILKMSEEELQALPVDLQEKVIGLRAHYAALEKKNEERKRRLEMMSMRQDAVELRRDLVFRISHETEIPSNDPMFRSYDAMMQSSDPAFHASFANVLQQMNFTSEYVYTLYTFIANTTQYETKITVDDIEGIVADIEEGPKKESMRRLCRAAATITQEEDMARRREDANSLTNSSTWRHARTSMVQMSLIRPSLSASYATSTSKGTKKIKSSKTSTGLKKKVSKDSEETKRSSKSWFGIDAELEAGQSESATPSPAPTAPRARPLRAPTANDSLSEWELPESATPPKRRSFDFASPLRGDFTDLSAPVAMSGEDLPNTLPVESRRTSDTRMAPSSRASSMSSPAEESYHLSLHAKPAAKVDLGLDDASRRILARGVPDGVDIADEYMKERDMNDAQWTHAKHSMAPIPPLGSWEAEDTAARRVVEILTMPVHGPSPYYKGRDIRLFTHDEKEYFDKYPRTVKNYNRFIWSLAKNNDYPAARKALAAMKEHGLQRDVGIYTSLIQGCVTTKDPREAMRVFVEMRQDGIKPDLWAFDALMEVFVATGELDGAFALYDELKPHGLKPTAIIFTTLIKGCLRDNDLDRAWKVFDHMRVWHCEPDEVLMNLMIHACAKNSEAERAMTLFNQLKGLGIRPTQVTFNSLMFAFSRRKDYYAQAWDMLKTMKVEGYAPDYRTFDMLLAVAGKGGDVSTAELVFDEAVAANGPKREQPYAFMMEAYAMAHRVHAEQANLKSYIAKAEKLFERMIADGIKPTAMSCNLRLNVYTYNSMSMRAVEWKKEMKEIYGVQPDVYTYTSLIEMFGRIRQMDLALDQFNLMKAEGLVPSFTTYGVLIEGCTRGHLITTGMKLLREMKAKNIDIKPDHTFIVNFRRGLTKTPDIVREIDQLTGKAYRFVMPWRRKGAIKKITYHRELTKEEAKRTSLYG